MTKSNLGPEQPSLSYKIVGNPDPARIEWAGESPHTAVNLLDDTSNEEKRSNREEAKEFLKELLQGGAVPSEEVFTKGKKQGFSPETLRRAKKEVGIKARLVGQGRDGKWHWELPEMVKEPSEMVNNGNLTISDQITDPNSDSSTISPEMVNSAILTISAQPLTTSGNGSETPSQPQNGAQPAPKANRPRRSNRSAAV